jgi:hypothetical protein
MFFLPLMLPCVPQFLAYVKGTPGQGELDDEWMTNFLAHLLGGIPWSYPRHWDPGSLELRSWFSVHQWLGLRRPGVSFLDELHRRPCADGGGV